MKRFSFACLLVTLFAKIASAQSAKINVVIVNVKTTFNNIYISDLNAPFDPAKKGGPVIALNNNHTGTCTVNIKQPGFVGLDATFAIVKDRASDKSYAYNLFLTPGDDLTIKIDPTKKDNNVTVTGRGSNNNQPEIFTLTDIFSDNKYADDKNPYRALPDINKQQKLNKVLLNNYIAKYKPSEDFIKFSQLNVIYYAAVKYLFMKTKNLDPARNYGSWQKVQDSLFNNIRDELASYKLKDIVTTGITYNSRNDGSHGTANLNNDASFGAFNYNYLVSFFTEREYERLMMEQSAKPGAFYKEMYHASVANGKKMFTDEEKNLLQEKVINKHFSGKTGEYLYAEWINRNLQWNKYNNIDLIFDHFKQKYPNSIYIAQFSGPINAVLKRQNQAKLNDKMVFAPHNGSKLNTLKDVLALTKGRTILVDMWGTWCSPCREAIEEHSAALEAHFKGKGVDFLYIANHDKGHEEQWKKLIAYYHMEGTHILANDKLDKDIMAKIKGEGYPTYFIIKKDGSYQLTKTQYPIDRQEMIKELELASR